MVEYRPKPKIERSHVKERDTCTFLGYRLIGTPPLENAACLVFCILRDIEYLKLDLSKSLPQILLIMPTLS